MSAVMPMKAGKKVTNLSLNNIRIEQVFSIKLLSRTLKTNIWNSDHARQVKADTESGIQLMQMATTIKAGLSPKVAV